MANKTLTVADLGQFTGTENWYRHAINRNITYTDGVKYMAETAGAYWLIDEIALLQTERRVKAEQFQVWTLKIRGKGELGLDELQKAKGPEAIPVKSGPMATLTCDDGNGNVVFTKPIAFTDFPLPEIKIWCVDNVILLPSEY